MFIKICGITNKADAFAAVEAGADGLGFVLWPKSKRYVSLEAVRRIVEMLPSTLARVAVLVNPTRDEVEQILTSEAIDTLQFHGDESPEFCAQWVGRAKIWRAFRVADAASLAPIAGYSVVDAVLLDSYSPTSRGGTGQTFDWSLACAAKKFGKPLILSGGLNPDNVHEAVAAVQPAGVDVSSGIEISPGRKDHDRIRDFVRACRQSPA